MADIDGLTFLGRGDARLATSQGEKLPRPSKVPRRYVHVPLLHLT